MNRITHALGLLLATATLFACQTGEPGSPEDSVNFESSGALAARHAACTQNYDHGARKGAGAEDYNSTMLWSVSPYLVLLPSTGVGYVQVNVDATHYDWLLYTTADVEIESVGGPDLELHGPVTECPELNLVEYGVHHPEAMIWQLVLTGGASSRAQFYAGLASTDHSDPEEAGHAGHILDGDANVLDNAGHTLDSDPAMDMGSHSAH